MKNNRADEFIKDYKKALHTLAIPLGVSFGISTIYTIVDTIFVGGLGPDALAALSFSMPVFFILFSIAIGLGTGFSTTISMALGAKDKKRADHAAEHALALSVILSLVIGILGWFYCRELFMFLGATGKALDFAVDYMSILFIAVFALYIQSFARSILSGEGDMHFQMKVVIISVIINTILDPILIYLAGWGVAGAAWATIVAHLFSTIVFLQFLLSKKGSYINITFKNFSFDSSIVKQSLIIGIPAMVAQLVMSVGQAFINFMIAPFGSLAVAGFGIGNKLDFIVFTPFIAISGGVTTLAGMFWGAKRCDLIRKVVNYAMKLSMLFAIVTGVIFFIFAEQLLSIFTDDTTVIAIGANYVRLMVFTYPMIAIGINIGRMLIGVGKSLQGLAITSTRVLVVFIPTAIFFVHHLNLGTDGVWYAILTGSFISTLVAIAMLWRFCSCNPK